MSLIKVECIDQTLKIVNSPLISSGNVLTDIIEFSFCPMWSDYIKTSVFYRDESEVYHVLVDKDTNQAIVPREVLLNEGYFYFGVFGIKDEKIRTSQVLRYRVVKGAILDGKVPDDPTPDIYTQILTAIENNDIFIQFASEAEINAIVETGHEGDAVINVTRLNQYNQGIQTIIDGKISSEIDSMIDSTIEETETTYEYTGG